MLRMVTIGVNCFRLSSDVSMKYDINVPFLLPGCISGLRALVLLIALEGHTAPHLLTRGDIHRFSLVLSMEAVF